jgi:hypothetical protein
VSDHQEAITAIYQEQNTITKDEEFDGKDTLPGAIVSGCSSNAICGLAAFVITRFKHPENN